VVPGTDSAQLQWLLSRACSDIEGANESVAIAADGQLLAVSDGMTRPAADRLRAVTFAFGALARGTGQAFDLGGPGKVIIDLDRGYLIVSFISAYCLLGLVVSGDADLGALTYDVATFANQIGSALTDVMVREIGAAWATSEGVVTER
jgi:uncharacterized protein